MTPQAVHHGQAEALIEVRSQALKAAFIVNPGEGKLPTQESLPPAAWINAQHDMIRGSRGRN